MQITLQPCSNMLKNFCAHMHLSALQRSLLAYVGVRRILRYFILRSFFSTFNTALRGGSNPYKLLTLCQHIFTVQMHSLSARNLLMVYRIASFCCSFFNSLALCLVKACMLCLSLLSNLFTIPTLTLCRSAISRQVRCLDAASFAISTRSSEFN